MFEQLLTTSTLALANALPVYWACLVAGGGLLVISALGGGDSDTDVDGSVDADTDVDGSLDVETGIDADADLDVDADLSADAGDAMDTGAGHALDAAATGTPFIMWLAGWFSLRFVIFFAAVFGVCGVVLTYLADLRPGAVLSIALVAGLAVGQGVHQLFRRLRRASSNSAPRPQDYVHKLGQVTIAINHPLRGEVALQVRDARRYVPAVAGHPGASFGIGEEVVIVAYRAGIAEVLSRREYENSSAPVRAEHGEPQRE